MDIKISASVLSADPMQLGDAVKSVENANVDFIHIDVMDGHFVPNLTMGTFIAKGIKDITNIPLDIHLMIDNPDEFIKPFAEIGDEGDIITFHIETTDNPLKTISSIKDFGLLAGVALNPLTPIQSIENLMESVDLILAMTVIPGFSGQKFMTEVMPKLENISKNMRNGTYLEVDGGLTAVTIPIAVRNGANLIAAASSIFNPTDTVQAVQELRNAARKELLLTN
ncbi:MAG: ribulose-phosphate 3-epimerase [Candidatus Anammoxibacter sp.]